ncbi:MAG: chemotaxis protein CheW [Cyanobacteria bacterium J06623_7]
MSMLSQADAAGVAGSFPVATQHLKFKLYPDTSAMLPIEQITEVLKLQLRQITPIPQMPSWVMGVHNWRGDILWMFDLGAFLGLDSWYQHQHQRSQHAAIILSPERRGQSEGHKLHLGLVVADIEDLEHCQPGAIQAAVGSQVNSRLANFLQGYWLKSAEEMILALDGRAIAAAMPK